MILTVHTENSVNEVDSNKQEDNYGAPIDISDIINICKEFSQLGINMQNQIDNILDLGVEKAIRQNIVQVQSLPHIKQFLSHICSNVYLGDASEQANEVLFMIKAYEYAHPEQFMSKKN